MTVETTLAWAANGQQLIDDVAARFTDADVRAPSALPGWSRGHVLTHLARNADALVNLLTWARTGVRTPMYANNEERARSIEAGAGRDAVTLAHDVRRAAAHFADTAAAMPADAWDAKVLTNSGRETTAAEVPWMRVREVWLHVVDLGAGVTVDQIPGDVAWELAREVAAWMSPRIDTAIDVVAHGYEPLRMGSGDGAGEVHGTVQQVAAWLTGRLDLSRLHARGPIPELPAWL